ncbi:MAG: hypothetical protein Q9222_006237 [Ikaeria aurantiellina]
MRYYTIVLAALSLEYALAQPAHRHIHKHRRTVDVSGVDFTKIDYSKGSDVDVSGVDFTKIDYSGAKAPAPVPEAPKKAAAAPKVVNVIPLPVDKSKSDTSKSESSGSKSSGKSDTSSGSTGGAGSSFGGRTPGHMGGPTNDQYTGNVGSPYGSNMMVVNAGDVDKYKYTNIFKNTGSTSMPIQVWNKCGRDGQAQSGMGEEPNLKFTLQPGESKAVAFDENTLAAFSRQCDRDKNSNLPMCVWGELTFGSEMPAGPTWQASNKWSGFDRSSIPAGANEVLTMSCSSCGSDETTSSREKNAWKTAADTPGKNGVPPGPVHLVTEMSM